MLGYAILALLQIINNRFLTFMFGNCVRVICSYIIFVAAYHLPNSECLWSSVADSLQCKNHGNQH